MSKPDFSKPQPIDAVTRAFPARIVGTLLPLWEDLPEDLRSNWHRQGGTGRWAKWLKLMNDWFYSGLKSTDGLKAKEGIDLNTALQHIHTCLGSFEPKHEHKTAGVAYLMSLWLDESSTWEPRPRVVTK